MKIVSEIFLCEAMHVILIFLWSTYFIKSVPHKYASTIIKQPVFRGFFQKCFLWYNISFNNKFSLLLIRTTVTRKGRFTSLHGLAIDLLSLYLPVFLIMIEAYSIYVSLFLTMILVHLIFKREIHPYIHIH